MDYHSFSMYQSAAVQMCFRLGQNPHAIVGFPDGSMGPFWFLQAKQMSDFATMVELMRQFGVSPI